MGEKTVKQLNKERKRIFIACIIFKLVLTVIYFNLVTKLFGYVGYPSVFSLSRFILSNFCFAILLITLPRDVNSISYTLNITLFAITIVPFMVVFEFSNFNISWLLLVVACFLLQNLILRNVKTKSSHKTNNFIPNRIATIINIVVGLVVIASLLINYGLPDISNLDFYKISEVRGEFESKGIISMLLLPLFARIINLVCLYNSLKNKRYLSSAFFILLQLLIYLITGFKTYLFLPVLIFAMLLLRKKNIPLLLIYGLTVMVVASWVFYAIFNEPMIPALFVNRLLFLPARIKFCYFDFFSDNPYLYFSQSTIGNILNISSDYNSPIPNLIGEKYFNSYEMYCNTGYMLSGYSDLGVIGMFLMTVIVSVIFKLSERITADKGLVLALLLNYVISLNDGSIITIMFSGGLLVAMLYLFFVDCSPKDKKYKCLIPANSNVA